MRSRPLALGGLITAVALLAAGCSGAPSTSTADGGTFVYAIGEPDHLTPGRQTVGFAPVQAVFSPLVTLDAQNHVQPVQAQSVTSDDNTTWTVRLRNGWTFHNGERVTAKSYVDAWNTTAYGPNAWENSGELAAIAGYADVHPATGKPKAKTMSGLKVVDDRTFTVQLVGADSSFPLQLSDGQTAFYPMPAAAYKDLKAYDRKPIGDGPFRMTGAWKANTQFEVTRYAKYAGTAAKTAGITFRPYADQNTAYTDVLAGNADLQFLPDSKYTTAEADFGDRLHMLDAPGIDYLGFPTKDPRYADKRVRQAISMAIDRKAVNKAIYGGLYEPATALTPPAQAGTPEGVCGRYCTFDPAAAKALLAEAGGFSGAMKIVYPGGIGGDELFQAYANQIRQNLGVKDVTAAPTTDFAEYYQTLIDGSVAGPHFGHWGALYTSQQNTLRALFTKAGGCSPCTGGYANADVDRLLNAADAADSPQAAIGQYVQVQKRVMRDFPIVPTFFDKYGYVTSPKISKLPSLAGTPIVSRIELAG